jgi:hypothetical protein
MAFSLQFANLNTLSSDTIAFAGYPKRVLRHSAHLMIMI